MADKNYYLTEQIGNSGIANTRNPYFLSNSYDPFEISPREINVGDRFSSNSKLDPYLGDIHKAEREGLTIDDLRAEKQSGWDMLGNALANNIVIAGTTAVSGTLGVIDGILEAASSGDISKLWDNDINNWAVDVQDAAREAMPIYRGQEYQDSSIWSKLGTGIFWADLLQNLGFTEGMLVPGMGMAKALAGAPSAVRAILPSIVSSMGEGAIEAINNKNEEVEKKKAIANQMFNERAKQVSSPFELEYLTAEYEDALDLIDQDAVNSGNFVFGSNIVLLSLTNSLEFGRLFSGGFGTAKKVKGALRRGEMGYTVNSKAKTIAKSAGRKLVDAFTEGMEEVNQKVISSTPANYADYNTFNDSEFNNEKRELVSDMWSALGKTYAETLQDGSTAEEFAMGFLTGLLGVPTLRKAKIPIGLENSIFTEVRDALRERKEAAGLVDDLNKRLADNKRINAYYNGLVRNTAIQEDKNKALDSDDEFLYKNAESAQLLSDIVMFDEAGDLEFFKQMVQNATNFSDEEIKSIAGDSETVEDVRERVERNQAGILNAIDKYAQNKKMLERTFSDLTQQDLKNALFIGHQLNDLGERNQAISRELLGAVKASDPDNIDLQSLTQERFNKLFKDNKDFRNSVKAAVESLEAPVRMSMVSKINDLERIHKSIDRLNTAYADILTNPGKSDEELSQTIEKKQEEYDKNKQEERINYLTNMENEATSLGEIINSEREAYDYNEDEIKEARNRSTNPMSKEVSKTEGFLAEVQNAIEKSDVEDSVKELLLETLNGRLGRVDNYSDLSNPYLYVFDVDENPLEASAEGLLGDYIEMANSAIANKVPAPTLPSSTPAPSAIPGTTSSTTGASDTSTIPVATAPVPGTLPPVIPPAPAAPAAPAGTTAPISPDAATPEIIARRDSMINEARNLHKEIEKALMKYHNDNGNQEAYYEALTLYNKLNNILEELINNKKAYNLDDTYVDKLIAELNSIEKSLPVLSQDVKEGEEETDLEKSETPEASTEPYNYYRSDITEFEIGAATEGRRVPYVSTKGSVSKAQAMVNFTYVNEGNVKEGDKIELVQEVIDGDTFTFMVHKGVKVGILPFNNPKYRGIENLNKRLASGEKIELTVSKVMLGRIAFTRGESRSLKDVKNLPSNVRLAVRKPINGIPSTVTNTKDKVEPVADERNADGRVYLLIPNSKGTLSPKRIRVKHFNRDEFNIETLKDSGNTRAAKLHELLTILSKINNSDTADKVFKELNRVLYLGPTFHLNYETRGGEEFIILRNGDTRATIKVSEAITEFIIGNDNTSTDNTEVIRTPETEIYNKVLDFLYQVNPIFNIDGNRINRGNYNTDLINDDILYTYISDAEMKDAWFTTNYFDESGTERKAVNPKGAMPTANPHDGTRVTVDGKQYYVEKGEVYDSKGNTVQGDTQRIKDAAWVKEQHGNMLNGVDLDNGECILPSGKGFNVRTNTYLSDTELIALKQRLGLRISKVEEQITGVHNLMKYEEEHKTTPEVEVTLDDTNPTVEVKESDGSTHVYNSVKARQSNETNRSIAFSVLSKIATEEDQKYTDASMANNTVNKKLNEVIESLKNNNDVVIPLNINATALSKVGENRNAYTNNPCFLTFNPTTGKVTLYTIAVDDYLHNTTGRQINRYRAKKEGELSDAERDTEFLNKYAAALEQKFGFTIDTVAIMPFFVKKSGNKVENIIKEQTLSVPRIVAPTIPSTPIAPSIASTPTTSNLPIFDYTGTASNETGTYQGGVPKKIREPKDGEQVAAFEIERSVLGTVRKSVVKSPVSLIGNINGVPVYFTRLDTDNKGAFECYVVFPNGKSILIGTSLQNGFSEDVGLNIAKDAISTVSIEELQATLSEKTALSNGIDVSSFSTPQKSAREEEKEKLRQSLGELNKSNKGDTAKTELPEAPKPTTPSPAPESIAKPWNNSWKDLDTIFKQALEAMGYSESQWNSLSENDKKQEWDCLGMG